MTNPRASLRSDNCPTSIGMSVRFELEQVSDFVGMRNRGAAAVKRLQGAYSNITLVHLPVHASWLNQVEIYFSVIQRKVLTPNDFTSLQEVSQRLLAFQDLYERAAKPFEWKFTRADLQDLMNRLSQKPPLALAA